MATKPTNVDFHAPTFMLSTSALKFTVLPNNRAWIELTFSRRAGHYTHDYYPSEYTHVDNVTVIAHN